MDGAPSTRHPEGSGLAGHPVVDLEPVLDEGRGDGQFGELGFVSAHVSAVDALLKDVQLSGDADGDQGGEEVAGVESVDGLVVLGGVDEGG